MASKVSGVIEKINVSGTERAIASTAYGYCETAAGTAAKVVDMTDFKLYEGVTIHVKFKEKNSAANPTLNVQGTGAKPIVQYGTTAASTADETSGWYAGAVLTLTYDGTSWVRDQGFNTNGITSVTVGATSPIQSSTSTAQTGSSASTTISLADAYGDTKNPYGSKTKNYVLAAPSNANGAPSFRALVATDIPNKIQTNWELNATSGNSPALLFTRDGSLTDWKIFVTSGKLSFQSATDGSTWTERAYFKDNSGDFVATSFTGKGSDLTDLNGSNISSGTVALARLPMGNANTALMGKGSSTAPAYVSVSPSISITAGTADNAPKVNLTVLGVSGTTAQELTKATTGVYGATKLYDGVDSTSTTLAATANAVKTAYDKAAGIVAAADAMVFKGTLDGAASTKYTPAADRGHTYKVAVAGLINGEPVEIGDILICTTDSTAAATSSNVSTVKANWVIIQNNVDGAVFYGSNSLSNGQYLVADGANGKVKSQALPTANTTTAGITTVGASGGAAAYSHGTHVTTATVQEALGITSSGSATKALTEKGTFVTFGTSNLTIGTTSSTAMAGDTVVTNVAISANTITNANYPIVFATSNKDTTAAKNEGLQKSGTKFYFNPSTGNVQATTFNGYTLAAACAKAVTDSSGASAISTGTSLPTERDIYYGLPTINGIHNYDSSTNYYIPTAVGTSGQVLKSQGSGAPEWEQEYSVEIIRL